MSENTKKEIKFFISYAHENDRLATSLIEKFKTLTKLSLKYQYFFWSDKSILPGENWEKEIQKAIKECTLGLLLVSPEFLASDYITKEELSNFKRNKAKSMFPIALLKINFKLFDLKGLQKTQFYLLKKRGFSEPKAYSQCNSSQRDDFVQDLFEKVESRLNKLFKGGST